MMTSIPIFARSASVVLVAALLAGCQDFQAQVFEHDIPRAETTALYCYRTLARADCYEAEVEGWEDRLIGIREAYTRPVEDEDANGNGAASQAQPGSQAQPESQAQPDQSSPRPPSPAPLSPDDAVTPSSSRLPGSDIPTRVEGQPLTLTR